MSPSAAPTPPPDTIEPGSIIAGKYVVERVLGEGGMGVVVLATHRQLGQKVAIKCLLPKFIDEKEVVARFVRESQAAIKIRSEHVVRIFDVGELPTGAPYMVMEYLEGKDLDELIRDGGPLPVSDAVDYLLQALEAIAEAHALGMVHRDLKPANLFLSHRVDGSACIKVLDFGISKVASRPGEGTDMGLTSAAAVMGSPHYMAPEQMRSARDVDARADIWALGAILHEVLAGGPPFRGATYPELFSQILQDRPPPFSNFRSDVPPALDQAVLLCMEKDPARRFSNVAELAFAIAPCGSALAQASSERIGRVLQVAPSGRMIAARASQDFGQAGTIGVPTGNSFTPMSVPAQSLHVGTAPPMSVAPQMAGQMAAGQTVQAPLRASYASVPNAQMDSFASAPPPAYAGSKNRTLLLVALPAGAIVLGALILAFAIHSNADNKTPTATGLVTGSAVNSSGSAIASASGSASSSADGAMTASTFGAMPPLSAAPSSSSSNGALATAGATPVTGTSTAAPLNTAAPTSALTSTAKGRAPQGTSVGSTSGTSNGARTSASPQQSAVAQRGGSPSAQPGNKSPTSNGGGINGNNVVNNVERDLRDGVNKIFH